MNRENVWNVTFWLVFWCLVATSSVYSLLGLLPAFVLEIIAIIYQRKDI